MDEPQKVSIRFPDMDLGEAGKAASDLREDILDTGATDDVTLEKDDPTTMDMGATLVAVLGTPAIIIIAKGIANWISRKRQNIEIEAEGDKIVIRASGSVDENTARIVEALQRK